MRIEADKLSRYDYTKVAEVLPSHILGTAKYFLLVLTNKIWMDYSGTGYLLEKVRRLSGKLSPFKIILPRPGSEGLFWERVVALLSSSTSKESSDWKTGRSYVILTNKEPTKMAETSLPFLSIDITDTEPWETHWLLDIIPYLNKKGRKIWIAHPTKTGGEVIFQQDSASFVPNGSVLDPIGIVGTLCSTIKVRFVNFKHSFANRYYSYVDGNTNNPNSIFFGKIEDERNKYRREFEAAYGPRFLSNLPEEKSIREFWD